jgi:hypothetical protein
VPCLRDADRYPVLSWADVEDHRVPPAETLPGLDVYSKERVATVNVHALSLYALAA